MPVANCVSAMERVKVVVRSLLVISKSVTGH